MANEITSQNVLQAIPKIVANQALPALVGNLVMGNLVNRDFEAALAQAGDTVNVAIAPAMTANNVAEAGSVTNQNPSLGNAQIVLNTHAEATFQIPDVTKIIAAPDLIQIYMRSAIIALAEKIETDLLSLYTFLTANTAVGSASALTEAVVDDAETSLFNAKVPPSEPRYLVLSATAYSQIRQVARVTEFDKLGDAGMARAAIASGEVSLLKGFRIFRSQFVQKPSSTTFNIGFARDAIGLAMRRLPIPLPGSGAVAQYAEMGGFGFRVLMSYAPNTLAAQITVDCLYGVAVLRNNHGVQVQSN